jgi:hypothetical protein
LLGQIDPEFAPIQLNALADERYQVCRALSVALSRIGPSIDRSQTRGLDKLTAPHIRFVGGGTLVSYRSFLHLFIDRGPGPSTSMS